MKLEITSVTPLSAAVQIVVLLLLGVARISVVAFAQPAMSSDDNHGPLFELQVVGPDGKAVPETNVEIRSRLAGVAEPIKRGELVDILGTYRWILKADGDGVLVVQLPTDAKRFAFEIQQPGFAPYWGEWDSQDGSQTIPKKFAAELDAGWSVGSVIVDADGNPIEGATVNPSIKFKKRPGDLSEL